jgi:hypothetical protein
MGTEQDKPTKQPKTDADVGRPAAPTVNWDDSTMKTSYANVVNASSTREEVTLFFGTNLTWNPIQAKELHVGLNDRIVLNPYAAKRLWVLLGAILKEYESRFGALNIDLVGARGSAGAAAAGDTPSRGNARQRDAQQAKSP